jgi:hypothetical protein
VPHPRRRGYPPGVPARGLTPCLSCAYVADDDRRNERARTASLIMLEASFVHVMHDVDQCSSMIIMVCSLCIHDQ